jgi:hypothetical protein
MIIVKNFISLEEYPYDGDIDIVHAHKVARTCLGFKPGVRDFRWGTGTENMGDRINWMGSLEV